MGLIRRYQLYKKIIYVTIVLNVLVLSLSLVSGYGYFRLYKQGTAKIQKAVDLADKGSHEELNIFIHQELLPLSHESQVGLQRMIFVGAFSFFMGILFPTLMLYKLNLTVQDLQRRAEKQLISWLNWWTKNNAAFKSDPKVPFYNRPEFWMNIGLFTLEFFGSHAKNPLVNYLAEIAPMIRSEIEKDRTSKAS